MQGPWTISRKNIGAFGSVQGVRDAAVYSTFIETCKRNDICPQDYFANVFSVFRDGNKYYESLFPFNIALMYLKSLYNLNDEGVVARWTENPYFTGYRKYPFRKIKSVLPRCEIKNQQVSVKDSASLGIISQMQVRIT